mmetsp:Transcript_247/g.566  ORF Transcript_247/g.566 Transcript_247/m.566 type:complete len:164 (-) Transcript_247:1542-2033(-)
MARGRRVEIEFASLKSTAHTSDRRRSHKQSRRTHGDVTSTYVHGEACSFAVARMNRHERSLRLDSGIMGAAAASRKLAAASSSSSSSREMQVRRPARNAEAQGRWVSAATHGRPLSNFGVTKTKRFLNAVWIPATDGLAAANEWEERVPGVELSERKTRDQSS